MLQDAFREGYMASPDTDNPYIRTSTLWDAFELGTYFRRTGRNYDLIRKSRGDTYKSARGEHFTMHYKPFRIALIGDGTNG